MINNDIEIRLSKLEESYYSLSTHLEGERTLRKLEDDKCKQLYEYLSNQILEIKEKESYENCQENFINLKEELLNILDLKIESKLLEKNKNSEIQYINNIDKINLNKSLEKENLEKEINQYKYNIDNINQKLEFMNDENNKKIQEISDKINEINIKFNEYQIVNKNVNDKIIEIKKVKEEYSVNEIDEQIKNKMEELNKMFEDKINNCIFLENNKNYMKYYEIENIDKNISLLKSDFDSLSNNYLKEINKLTNNLNEENSIKEKEIINFEQHFIKEYENFTKFITDILKTNVEKIKSMSDYLNTDIELIKNKNKYLEETLLKLREDIYDSLKQNIKYVLDKIHEYKDKDLDYINDNEKEKEINNNSIDKIKENNE